MAIIPNGTEVIYDGLYKGVVRDYNGVYSVEILDTTIPPGYFLHHCRGAVPSGRGRFCAPDELRVVQFHSPFLQSVVDYVYKELKDG